MLGHVFGRMLGPVKAVRRRSSFLPQHHQSEGNPEVLKKLDYMDNSIEMVQYVYISICIFLIV
jgi:hypothetical protein